MMEILAALEMLPAKETLVVSVFALTYLGMALGRVPGLRLDRTGMALLGLDALLAGGAVDLEHAGAAINMPTLLLLFARDANPLNALLLGEGEARHLGVNVQALKRRLILLTAAGVGVAVAVAGMIGFVGLVVPHLARLLAGPNHVRLLPLSALLGAALLLGADMLARTLLAPAEMPVGIITALMGAPFFIWLLVKSRRPL